MAVSPLLQTLVEVDEALAELAQCRIAPVHLDQSLLQLARRLDPPGHVALELVGRHGVALALQALEEGIPHGGLVVALSEPFQGRLVLRVAGDGPLALGAQRELELAELMGLEAAGFLEPLPESEELDRRHRLQDVQLRDEHLQDREDPLHRVLCPRQVVRPEELHDVIDLVKHFLEPELVDLMDDDEQHLIVLRAVG